MLKNLFDKYVIKALSHMAWGLFCSLIIGLVVSQLLTDNLMEAVDIEQIESFEAGTLPSGWKRGRIDS